MKQRFSLILSAITSPLRRAAFGLFCALLLATALPVDGNAAQRPFTARYTANTNGDILLIGNTAMSCDPNAANCTNARSAGGGLTGANLNNNNYVMYYVDQGGAVAASSSTSALLNMPAGSTVLWAGLYWGGESSSAARSSVQLQTPSSTVTVNASQVDSVAGVGCSASCDRYSSFADVTNLVQVAGNGTYTVNGVTGYLTNAAVSTYAGWSLVVVLQNASRPLRNLTVFDGLVEIGCNSPLTTSFPVSGFLTPYSGAVNTVMGVVAGEGDLGSYGDYLQLNNTKVGDALRLVNGPNGDNFFMSANTNLGAYVNTGSPNFQNLLGWDIARVQANSILPNGSTGATISLGTAAECYYPNVTSFMTDLYVPIVAPNITKTAVKVGSGSLIPGDTLRFTVNVGNTGIDAATNVILKDLIPTWTTYKPGTLQVVSGANVGAKSDTAGNDQAEYCDSTTTPSCAQPQVIFRLGPGATGAVGGTLVQNAFTSISFDTTVNLNIPSGTLVTNTANVSYNGQTLTTTSFSNASNQVQAVVLTPPAITKLFIPSVVNIGATSAMTITLTNPANNAGTVSGVSFTDTYPAGLINDTANPNPVISCTAGSTPGSLIGGGAGGTSIGVTGATILQNGSCTITVNVKSNINQNGNYLNSTGSVATTNAGTSTGASAYLSVGLPTISKAFSTSPATSPPSIVTGGTASATFTLTSQAATPITGVGFTDALPAGLSVVTGSLNAAQCGGTVSYNAGANTITLTGGTLAALGTCTVTVPITSATAGYYSNTANGVTSAQTAVAGPPSNTAYLTVNAPPNITKSFFPPSIIRGQDVSQMTITVTNPNSVNAASTSTITGVAFTDTYPGTTPNILINSNNPLPTITCTSGSNATLTGGAANGPFIGISNGSLAPGGSCTITVYVTTSSSATPGNYVNSTGAVTTTNAGTGAAASGTLNVSNLSAPTTVKSFSPTSVPRGQPSTMTIRLTNANASNAITGVAFTDTYPAGLVNTATPGMANSCGGTVTTVAGGSSLALTGGTIPASSFCTITVQVQGNAAGALFNAVPIVITGNAGTGSQASATLTVVDPPVITKSFSPNAIRTGTHNNNRFSTLTITVTNPATNNATLTALTGVAFTDTYPAGIINNTTSLTSSVSCTAGSSATLTGGADNGNTIGISNGTLAAGGSCTVTAHITSNTVGVYTNTISTAASGSTVTSTNGGTGNIASDILSVGHIAITKSFAASPIPYGGTTTMTIVLTNARSSNITDAAFTDTYPAGMTNAATPAASMTCTSGTVTGTLTAPANGNYISLTNGGTIASNGGTCTITVTVSAATASADNIIPVGAFTGGGDSNSDPAEAILATYQPPGVVKSFAPSSIGVNTPSVLTITISNPNSIAATGTSFTDSYTGGLVNTATPTATQTCSNGTTTGTVTGAANSTSLALSGATIPANGSCTITVNVTNPNPGSITNQTGPIASTTIGTNSSGASASLTVLALPTMTKSFSPNQINVNGTSLLTVTLTNPNSTPITGAAFTDTYPISPVGLVNTATPGATTSCLGGAVTAAPGGTSLALSGATIPASGSCTVTVNVTSASSNNYTNSISQLVTNNAGTINFSPQPQDTLRVVSLPAPTVAKSFLPAQIIVNGAPNISTMTVTLTNNSATTAVTGVAFTDNLPAGMTISGTPATPQCGGAVSKPTSGTLQLTGGTIPANGSCTITATVTSAIAGGYTNTINAVTSTNAGTGGPVSANLSAVYNKPSATKTFNPITIGTNGTSLLTITLTNPNPAAVTGISTTDNYPTGLVNTGTPTASTTCGGSPVITAPANGNYITLSGASIPANNSCTVSVNVTSDTAGTYANSTGQISSANAVTGDAFGPVNLTVVGTTLVKSFSPGSVAAGQPSTMRFIITNNNTTTDITGVAFNDTFPTSPGQMVVAATPNLTNTCGGGVYRGGTTTPIATGDTSLSFSGGAILRSSSCTITLDVTVPTGGSYTNTTSQVTTANAGTGTAGTANLVANILPAPTTAKSFLPTAIGIGMPSTLMVTLTNNSSSAAVNGVTFTDSFPSSPGQMVVASSPNLNNGCGGTVTIAGDGKSFTLSGGTIPVSGNCTVKIDVTATVAGSYSNSTGAVTSANATAGSAATASLAVSGTTLDKRFNNVYSATIVATTTATLRFIITNGANNPAQAGIGFTDTLATNLVVAGPPSANSCGASIYKGGTTTPVSAGDTAITVSGGSMSAGVTSCTIDIPVTSSVRGTYQNDSTNISNPTININTATINAGLVTVLASPTLSKSFNPTLTSLPGNSTITFTITNNEAGNPSISGLGFTDLLPNNLNVSGTITSPQCGGTVSYTTNVPTNSSIITFANGTLTGASCTITVPVTSANVASTFTNSYPANINGLAGGLNASGASATLTVTSASASLVKTFNPATIGIGGSSTLTLTINNANLNPAQSGLNFIDNLPGGVTIVGTPTSTCGGTLTYTGTGITLANGVLAQNAASCAIIATVTSSTAGSYTNSTINGNITNTGNKPDISGTGAVLNVVNTTLGKAFLPNAVGVGQTTTLRFTISNGSSNPAQTNLGFTDTLPANLTVSGTPASPQCGGSVSYSAGTNALTFASGFLTSGTASCTIDVPVTSNSAATYTNSSANGNFSGATGGLNTTGAAAVLYVLRPNVTKSFGTNPVLVNTPSTLTITLSNSNATQDITGVSFTDTLPNLPGQMVIAPIPNLSNSCGGTSTASGTFVQLNGGTIPHNGSCTVAVDIIAPSAGSYVNNITTATTTNAGSVGPVTASLTVLAQPTIQLSKTSNNGTGTFTYAMTNLASGSDSITTAVAGTPVSGAINNVTSSSTNVMITETVPGGWPANPTAASCIDNNAAVSGNPLPPTAFGSLAGNILTIPSANLKPAAQVICSFTNTKPTVQVQKTSTNGTGTFAFAGTNGVAANFNLTTTVAGTTVAGTVYTVTSAASAVTVTETAPGGWPTNPAAASCTDTNGAVSGNGAGTFGTLAGNVLTIPTVNLRPAAQIICSFTNTLAQPTVQVAKTSNNGTGTFAFAGTNGVAAIFNITTATAGTQVSGSLYIVGSTASNVTVTETPPAGWPANPVSASCTDANGTVSGNGAGSFGTLAGNILTILPANLKAGGQIVCSFVNTKPTVQLQKTSSNGTGTFTYALTNIATTSDSITTTVAGTPVNGVANNIVTSETVNVTITETSPSGWPINPAAASCTDSNGAVSGNGAGSFGTLAGNVLTILAANLRPAAQIVCSFTNTLPNPTVQLRKTSNNGTGTFSYAMTNLAAGSDSIVTAVAGTPVNGANNNVTLTSSSVTVTETPPAGWPANPVSASCTDANGTVTGNGVSTFGTLAGNILTIPSANLRPGAQILCAFVNTKPTVQVRKTSTNGTGTFTYAMTNLANVSDSIITTVAGTPVNGVTSIVTSASSAVTVTETAPSGWPVNPVFASCTDANGAVSGNGAVSFGTLAGNALTIPTANLRPAAQILCSFTNTLPDPTVQLRKTSNNGTGTFTYAMTNLAAGSDSITTAVAGTPVNGASNNTVTSAASNVTVTETAPAGWPANPVSASCTDTNGTVTGNGVGSFGTLAGNVLTIPASNLRPAAQIVCAFVNAKPTIQVQKTSTNGTGTFTYAMANLANASDSITTTVAGTPVNGVTSIVTSTGSAVTVTETAPSGWPTNPAAASCTDTNGAVSGNGAGTFGTLAGNVLTIPTASLKPAAQIVCSFTNTLATPTVQLRKISNNGTGTFTYTMTNLVTGSDSITTAVAGTPVNGTTSNVTSTLTNVTVTETASAGWPANPVSASCNDSNGTVSGNGASSFGTLAGNILTIPSANLRAGAQILCNFVNTAVATITVNKALAPISDSGTFNLLVGATTVASAVGNGGTGNTTVPANSTVTVSETGAGGTSLADYTSAYNCTGGISGSGTSVNITPSAGQAITCSFTNTRNGFSVSGTIYSDANHNGAMDGGETGTGQSLFIKLSTRSGVSCASPAIVSAAANPGTGAFTLPLVTAGDYCLILDDNATLTDTTPAYPSGWIGMETPGGIHSITVVSTPVTARNFGMYNGGRLSGRVYNDTGAGGGVPNNGIQDGAEAGLAGVTVRATDNGGGTSYDSTVSNGSGDYTLWIPATAGNNSIKITETNQGSYVSTGGSGGTTGGSYNRASDTVTFTNTVGTIYSGVSFADVPGNSFVSSYSRSVVAGGVVFYPHIFTAGTGGTVTFSTSAVASPAIAGWGEVLYLDSNCNGSIDSGDPQIAGAITTTAGQQVCILVKEFAPANAPTNATNNVTVTASFGYSNSALPAATLTVTDLTTVLQSGLTLLKYVDKASAIPGDTLVYTINYVNTGLSQLSNIIISDNIPTFTNSPSACCVNPSTACLGAPPTNYPSSVTGCTIITTSSSVSWTLNGNLDPGASGQVKFSVKIDN